jgi:hypothetical protein
MPADPTGKRVLKKSFWIAFTQAIQRSKTEMRGKTYCSILSNAFRYWSERIPLLEVVIDIPLQKAVRITNPVQGYHLDGVPLPLF